MWKQLNKFMEQTLFLLHTILLSRNILHLILIALFFANSVYYWVKNYWVNILAHPWFDHNDYLKRHLKFFKGPMNKLGIFEDVSYPCCIFSNLICISSYYDYHRTWLEISMIICTTHRQNYISFFWIVEEHFTYLNPQIHYWYKTNCLQNISTCGFV